MATGSLANTVIAAVVVLVASLINVLVVVYMELKFMADVQVRYGPMKVGFHGILQPIADALKLATKEDILPSKADKGLFILAPFLVFVPTYLLYMVIPIGENMVAANLNVGVFFIMAISSIIPVGIIVAGWASYNKYSLFGAMRSAAQQISYEVPLVLSFLGIVMMAGSLSLVDIVKAQEQVWFILVQPLAFLFFFIASMADLNRSPFDIPEAESEIVQGFFTEYSSMKFALYMLAEYSNVLVVSLLGALLFFGGWLGPAFLPPVVWLLIKTYGLVLINIWVRSTYPRVRIDQLMTLGWKILLPLTLANIVIYAFVISFTGKAVSLF